jgi:proline racemase
MTDWVTGKGYERIQVIDAHTAGEPLRLITVGLPKIEGDTILEKRAYMRDHLDHLRTALMFEPRGHADMYGCILTEPETEDGDFGVLFLHNEGYSTMCGHGVIALTTIAIEAGLIYLAGDERVLKLDTPAGRVTATAHMSGERVERVSFENVPSFVLQEDAPVIVEPWGEVKATIAFGGAFYAYVKASDLGLRLVPEQARQLIEQGSAVKEATAKRHVIRHPYEEDLSFLYGAIFTGPAHDSGNHSRNVCIFAEGEVDRSPTGTGVSGRAAIHYARGEIGLGEPIEIESILGTTFTVEAAREVEFGGHRAIVPRVTGAAYITAVTEFLIDPRDPLRDGFLIR